MISRFMSSKPPSAQKVNNEKEAEKMQEDTRLPSPSRQDTHQGEKRPVQVCQHRKAQPVTAAAFPNTLGAIARGKKMGTQIIQYGRPEKFQDIYDGVITSYGKIKGAPKLNNQEPALQLIEIWHNVKAMVPKGLDVIIQQSYNDNWCLNIYREVEYTHGWSVFPVGKVLKVLNREDALLHNIFLDFLKSFSWFTGSDLWYSGAIGQELEPFGENIMNIEDELEPEESMKEVNALYKNFCLYTRGLPAQYAERLRRNTEPIGDFDWFIQAVKQYPRHPIAKIIRKGVEVLKHGKSVLNYQMPHQDKYDSTYLPIDVQFSIAWQLDDALFNYTEQSLDSWANEGIEVPHQFMLIDMRVKKVKDFGVFNKEDTFIRDLQNFFDFAYKIITNTKKYV